MHAMATAAKKGWPYAEEEIAGLIRDTAIQLGAVDPVKKQPYHEGSDVSTLVSQFLRRCGEKGVPLVLKGGRKLAIQRWMKSSWEILDGYGKQTATPALRAFQEKHGKLTLEDVGNFDEAMVDLCDFAETGNVLVIDLGGTNVIVPFEQCPHYTIKIGFIGKTLMVCALIKIGPEGVAPHPHHAQLLKDDRTLALMQSPNGWTNAQLTTAFMQL